MNSWSTMSTIGKSTRSWLKWINYCLFWHRFGYGLMILTKKYYINTRWFFIFVVTTHLLDKTICTITTNQHNCWFLVSRRNFRTVAACLGLKTFMTAFIILFFLFPSMAKNTFSAWAISSRTREVSSYKLNWFFRLFKNIYPITKLGKKTNFFDLQK